MSLDQQVAGYDPFPGSLFVNDSGIQLDIEKYAQMPSGVEELEDYKEEWNAEGTHYSSRLFKVPWSTRRVFAEWCLGYEFNSFLYGGDINYPFWTAGPNSPGGGYSGAAAANSNAAQANAAAAAALQAYNAALVGGADAGTIAGLLQSLNTANAIAANTSPNIGYLVRIPPAQDPEEPWKYAVSCELQKGISIWTDRTDATVRKFDASAPYAAWDTDLYNGPAQHPDVEADGGVIQARANVLSLNSQVNQLTTLPLTASPGAVVALSGLLYPNVPPGVVNVPAAEFQQWTALINAPSMAEIVRLATGSTPAASTVATPPEPGGNAAPAARYLAAVAKLSQQLGAARQALVALRITVAAELTANLPRVVVPKIRFVQPDKSTGGRPFADGYALYRVTYRPLPWTVRGEQALSQLMAQWAASPPGSRPGAREMERSIERRVTWAVKSFQIPQGPQSQFVFIEGPSTLLPVPTPGQRLVSMAEIRMTWHNVPDIPVTQILACLGRINRAPFDGALGQLQWPADTLLCQMPEIERRPRNIRGRVTHKITYVFAYNPNTWNKFPDGLGNFYGARFSTPGANPQNELDLLYKHGDFDQLFQQPMPRAYQVSGVG